MPLFEDRSPGLDLLIALLGDGSVPEASVYVEAESFIVGEQLAAFVWAELDRLEALESLPVDTRRRFEAAFLRQWANAERLMRVLRELVDAFGEAGIEPMLLKGPYLAERYYGNLDRRPFGDLDLLVRDGDVEKAQDRLRGLGFARVSRVLGPEGFTRRFVHAFEFRRADSNVDLHWALARHCSFRIDHDRLWEESSRYRFRSGLSVKVPPDEYVLTQSLLGAFRDLRLANFGYRTLVDIYKILLALPADWDWGRFFERRACEGLNGIATAVLALVLERLRCGSRLPGLAADLDRRGALPGELSALQPRGTGLGLRNRRLAMTLYDAPAAYAFLWWLGSLPFRTAVYGRGITLGRLLEKT